jgi:hypothetical protein
MGGLIRGKSGKTQSLTGMEAAASWSFYGEKEVQCMGLVQIPPLHSTASGGSSMKNRVKLRTVLIIVVLYLFILISLSEVGRGFFIVIVLYSIAAIAGGYALLASDIALTSQDALVFRRMMPLRILGNYLVDFQHVFYHDEDLLPAILEEIDARIAKQGFLPKLQKKSFTDTDKNLFSPETREFFVSSSEANLRGTEVALAIQLRNHAEAQSIQWWVLMRGFIDRNKKVALLALAPIGLPFWLWAYLKQKLDLVSRVRTVYDAFYNSVDFVTDARALHTLVFDALVETLDKHGVDISDLKLQRAQVMNINITGGRTTFGNIVQALQQARVVQAGGRK